MVAPPGRVVLTATETEHGKPVGTEGGTHNMTAWAAREFSRWEVNGLRVQLAQNSLRICQSIIDATGYGRSLA